MQVSWECQEEMFRADVENADDVRLSVRLFRTCIKEKQTFCPTVAPGNSRAKDCLELNKDKPGFGDDCKCVDFSIAASVSGHTLLCIVFAVVIKRVKIQRWLH